MEYSVNTFCNADKIMSEQRMFFHWLNGYGLPLKGPKNKQKIWLPWLLFMNMLAMYLKVT